jgi:hypothetical protein
LSTTPFLDDEPVAEAAARRLAHAVALAVLGRVAVEEALVAALDVVDEAAEQRRDVVADDLGLERAGDGAADGGVPELEGHAELGV